MNDATITTTTTMIVVFAPELAVGGDSVGVGLGRVLGTADARAVGEDDGKSDGK